MKRRISSVLSCAVMLAIAASAQDISLEQAIENAMSFSNGVRKVAAANQGSELSLAYVPSISDNGNSEYYVFNNKGDNGFVIVSGSSKTAETVLGYCDNGHFDYLAAPPNLKELLNAYSREIKMLESGTKISSPAKANGIARAHTVRPSVAPLLGDTRWGQQKPFNNMTPGNSVTGCVATAMAQVMYYYKWPDRGEDYCEYPWGRGQILSVDFSKSVYDWDNMLPFYGGGYTSQQADAVAKLMVDAGYAVEEEYEAEVSIARTAFVALAMKQHFKYDNGARRVMRDNYTYEEWTELLYTELKEGRPIIMEGISVDEGHCFILDGYGKDDYYHINWGWAGEANGYFLLTALAPSNSAEGASGFGYSSDVGATIGIKPRVGDTPPYTEPQLHANQIKVSVDDQYSDSFTVSMIKLTNQSGFNEPWTLAVDVLDENYNILNTVFSTRLNLGFDPLVSYDFNYTVDSLKLEEGTYYVRPKFRLESEPDVWRDINHKYSQAKYPKLIKSTDTLFPDNGYQLPDLDITFTELDSIRYCGKRMSFKATVKNYGEEYYGPVQVYTYSTIWRKYYTSSEIFVVDLCKGDSTVISGEIELPPVSASIYNQRLVATGSLQATGSFMLNGFIDFLIYRPSDLEPVLSLVKELTPVSDVMPSDKVQATATFKNDGGYYEGDLEVLILPVNKMTILSSFTQHVRISRDQEQTITFSGTALNAEYGKQYRMVLRDPNKTIVSPWGNLQTFTIDAPGLGVIINGDLNHDGIVDVSDVNILIDIVLGNGDEDTSIDPDINSDGSVDVEDVNYLLNFVLGQY